MSQGNRESATDMLGFDMPLVDSVRELPMLPTNGHQEMDETDGDSEPQQTPAPESPDSHEEPTDGGQDCEQPEDAPCVDGTEMSESGDVDNGEGDGEQQPMDLSCRQSCQRLFECTEAAGSIAECEAECESESTVEQRTCLAAVECIDVGTCFPPAPTASVDCEAACRRLGQCRGQPGTSITCLGQCLAFGSCATNRCIVSSLCSDLTECFNE